MLSNRVFKLAVLAWLCLMIFAVPLVRAEEPAEGSTESFTVRTDKEEYLIGENVAIYVKAEAIDPQYGDITVTDVIVYNPNNETVAEWHNLTIVLTDTETLVYVNSITAEMEGAYTVEAEAVGCPWVLRSRWFFWCYPFRVYTDKPWYSVGEVARVYVKAGWLWPNQYVNVTDVVVYDPNGNIAKEWHGLNMVLYSGDEGYVGNLTLQLSGKYFIVANATFTWCGKTWQTCAFWWFCCKPGGGQNVIPEVPFGTVSILAALAGTTGMYTYRKKRSKKNN